MSDQIEDMKDELMFLNSEYRSMKDEFTIKLVTMEYELASATEIMSKYRKALLGVRMALTDNGDDDWSFNLGDTIKSVMSMIDDAVGINKS